MNIQEYISSGILESYVLGIASEEEIHEVERLSAAHPEIRAEIAAIQEGLEKYAMQFQKTPPAGIKDKIFAAIEDDNQITSQSKATEARTVAFNPSHTTASQIITPTHRNKGWIKFMAAAAVVLLLISIALNVLLFNRWQRAQGLYISLLSEKEVLAQQLQVNTTKYSQLQQDLSVVNQADVTVVQMKGTGVAPDAKATVFWSKESNQVYLAINNLPEPPKDKQYQLWAIVDGKPVDAGVIEHLQTAENGLLNMIKMNEAQAFAITLEKKGGSQSPTLEAMYVMGNV